MNKNLEQAENIIKKAFEAYKNGDVKNGKELVNEANSYFTLYTNEIENTPNNNIKEKTFGEIHAIFEHNSPSLFKTSDGKKVLSKYIKLIKENDCLKKQYSFYNVITNVKDVADITTFVNEAVKLIPKFSKKELKEANAKLYNILKENKVEENIQIEEEDIDLFESIDFLLSNEKNLKNLSNFINAENNVISHINENIKCTAENITEDKQYTSLDEMANKYLKNFNEKYDVILNETEKKIVRTIINAKFNNQIEECKNLYEEYKRDTLSSINESLKESEGEVKEKLLVLKEKTLDKTFNIDNMTSDLCNLIEIKIALEDEE